MKEKPKPHKIECCEAPLIEPNAKEERQTAQRTQKRNPKSKKNTSATLPKN
jgi:hypothetical protein